MRLLAFLVAALLAAAPLDSRADDAASLLAKHRAFAGWQFGDGTFTSLVMDGVIATTEGKRLYTVHKLEAGVVNRIDSTNVRRGWTTSSGFTGHIYWLTDQNGFTRPELGEAQKYNIAIDLLMNEATSALPGSMKGAATIDGTPVQIVRLSPNNADAIDVYVDPSTGAYKRAVIDPNGTYETTLNILDYADAAPSKKIVAKYRVGDGNVVEWQRFSANGPVAATDFHPPAARAHWSFANDKPFPITLAPHRIFVDAKINGVPGRFILDTGDGGGILLRQEFADKAHVKTSGVTTGYGFGGAAAESTVRIDSLEIGGNKLQDLYAVSQRFEYGRFDEADGLIGFDLLAGAIVSLDLSNGTMTISDPQTTSVDAGSGMLATVDLTNAIPKLPMKLNDIDVNVELDSGTPDLLVYGPDLRFKYGLTSIANPNYMIGGVGGYERVACGMLDKLTVGPIVYRGITGCESHGFGGRDALVGLDFMRHFNWIFDYPHAQLVIIPHPGDS